jgi:arabinose-5-phosphate isomerase
MSDALQAARRALEIESAAIARAADRLDEALLRAVEIIAGHDGKVVVTGVGKSGHVARKIAATLSSTGTPAVFLHPGDATHGDLGIYSPGDPTLLLTNAGTSAELARLLPSLRELRSPLIGIIGKPDSPLAAEMDVLLDASVEREADPEGLIPTASSVVALALGHALVIALMRSREFSADDFADRHPGGQIGRNLRLRVREAMHKEGEIAWVGPADPVRDVVIAMTSHPLGAACVINEEGVLLGIITDGDLRRALESHDDIRPLRARDIMTADPVTIDPESRLLDAMRLMENRASQISLLPVTDPASRRSLGLIRIHDICQVWLK